METKINTQAQVGDIAQLISAQNKRFIFRIVPDGKFETHRGYINHNDLIGKPWGTRVLSHMGSPFVLLQPSLADILVETRRNTQIMYPKDIGFILVFMDIVPGKHILEAGTGSGSFTTALAYAVGPQGRVTTYEIVEGFDEKNVDAVFLDLPNPQDYLLQAKEALKPGGHLGSIMPTTNQVSTLLVALRRSNYAFIEVCEILLRYYKAIADRLRPTDRMVAHTGYLVFARSVLPEIAGFVNTDRKRRAEIDDQGEIVEPSA
jgi:tRNA (adenine57-N1/adenine58-N1)-methyltransferase